VTLTSLAEEIGCELSALSQTAGRLRKRMTENKYLREKLRGFTSSCTDSITGEEKTLGYRTLNEVFLSTKTQLIGVVLGS